MGIWDLEAYNLKMTLATTIHVLIIMMMMPREKEMFTCMMMHGIYMYVLVLYNWLKMRQRFCSVSLQVSRLEVSSNHSQTCSICRL